MNEHPGVALRALRKAERFTQSYIAERIDCSVSHICDVEKGRCYPSWELYSAWIQALGYKLTMTIERDEQQTR